MGERGNGKVGSPGDTTMYKMSCGHAMIGHDYHLRWGREPCLWCKGEEDERIRELVEKGEIKDLNQVLVEAAGKDRLNLIRFLIEHGANNFDKAMIEATKEGNREVVDLLVEKGASDFDNAIRIAREKEYIHIVRFLKKQKKIQKSNDLKVMQERLATLEKQVKSMSKMD